MHRRLRYGNLQPVGWNRCGRSDPRERPGVAWRLQPQRRLPWHVRRDRGLPGTGIFTQAGGNNTPKNSSGSGFYLDALDIGGSYNGGRGTGTYILSGTGLLSCTGAEVVGIQGGSGTFTQIGGNNTIVGLTNVSSGIPTSPFYALMVGCQGSSGTYSLSGSGLLSSQGNVYIGMGGTGTFTQTGGTNLIHVNGATNYSTLLRLLDSRRIAEPPWYCCGQRSV